MSTSKVFGVELGFQIEEKVTRWVGILSLELVAVVIVGWLILAPRINEIFQVQSQISQQKKLLADLRTKVGLLEDFMVEYAGQDELMAAVFMPYKDTAQMLALIRDIADRAGMSTTGYRLAATNLVTPEQTGARAAVVNVEPVEIEITVSGSAANVASFLQLLDESLPIKRVTELEITKASLSGANLELKMKVASFTFPLKVQPNALGLIKPFSAQNRELFERLGTYYRGTARQTETLPILGNPNLFGL